MRGKLIDIKGTWHNFDGNTPHMTMPFCGSRISIVFFTRKKWLGARASSPEVLSSDDDVEVVGVTKRDLDQMEQGSFASQGKVYSGSPVAMLRLRSQPRCADGLSSRLVPRCSCWFIFLWLHSTTRRYRITGAASWCDNNNVKAGFWRKHRSCDQSSSCQNGYLPLR